MDHIRDCQLYLISPETVDVKAFAPKLAEALSAVPGRVGAFQLRLPDADDTVLIATAKALQPICAEHRVAFFLNDRPDLVVKLDADGIHLERSRKTVDDVRNVVGSHVVIGVSCQDSRDAAMIAGNAGADYVSFLASKPDLLEWWQELFVLPCVAVGGATPENIDIPVKAGADFIAVIRGVWDHPAGAGAAVKAFDAAIREALPTA